jgi:hypothetical protein
VDGEINEKPGEGCLTNQEAESRQAIEGLAEVQGIVA